VSTSTRWLTTTGLVGLAFAVVWGVSALVYELGDATSLEVAAVIAAALGIPLTWWSFRGQLLDEPAKLASVSWRRVPAGAELTLTRLEDQAALEEALRDHQGETSAVVVLTGPSGVGKTQLAAGYARTRMAEGWPLVAWIDAATHEEMLAGMLEFADALSLRVPGEGSGRAVQGLRHHPPLGPRPSVIVFDGVTDARAVQPYLPTLPGWQVIVTSAAPDAATLGTELRLDPPSAGELASRSGLSEETCLRLDRLPVAVDLASTTVREHDVDEDIYLQWLDSLAVDQLLGPRAEEGHPAAVRAALLALGCAGFETDAVARRLLALIAVLAPGGVSRALLHSAIEPREVDEAVRRLARWSLVSTRMDNDGLMLHELTRRVVTDLLRAQGTLPDAIGDAANLLARRTFDREQAWRRRGEGDQLVAHIAELSVGASSVSASLSVDAADRVLGLRQWATRQLSALGDGGRMVTYVVGRRSGHRPPPWQR
jgi:hypothetical protein